MKVSAASELIASYNPYYAANCLKYHQQLAELRQSTNLSDDLGVAIVQLGKIRQWTSHPRGDMNMILRYQAKYNKSPKECIDNLLGQKAGFTKPRLE